MPFYTPEPDVIHEVIGHANALAAPRYAALYRLTGQAARRVESEEALEFVSKVFWFTSQGDEALRHHEISGCAVPGRVPPAAGGGRGDFWATCDDDSIAKLAAAAV
ncbi:hypothetical protein AB0J35_50235 [Nonomuraea angiospora]|uniref:hypothetical protein n=1 Tax=Nonomuraea angiospora TaxID=46172 RepID=UPI0034199A19